NNLHVSSPININENLTIISSTIDVGAGVTANAASLTHTGLLDIDVNGDFNLDGAFSEQGGGAVSLSGDITTTEDAITFNDPVTLTADVMLNTGAGGGNVSFNNTLDDDGADSNRNLSITAGTGNVSFGAAVGGTRNLQSLTINSAA